MRPPWRAHSWSSGVESESVPLGLMSPGSMNPTSSAPKAGTMASRDNRTAPIITSGINRVLFFT